MTTRTTNQLLCFLTALEFVIFLNFLLQFQGALFFGVDTLLLKCKIWFSELISSKGPLSLQIQLDDLIHIWDFGLEHGEHFIWFLQPVRYDCISKLC